MGLIVFFFGLGYGLCVSEEKKRGDFFCHFHVYKKWGQWGL